MTNEKVEADMLVRVARIIARNIDDERFYAAPSFQRAAKEALSEFVLNDVRFCPFCGDELPSQADPALPK